jgi:hypothetical protein
MARARSRRSGLTIQPSQSAPNAIMVNGRVSGVNQTPTQAHTPSATPAEASARRAIRRAAQPQQAMATMTTATWWCTTPGMP